MAGMIRPSDAGPGPGDPAAGDPASDAPAARAPVALTRFDRGERVLHWANASLFAVLMLTAVCLYVPALSEHVGRRGFVKTVHVYAGLALPVPLLVTLVAGRWGSAFRADVGRLNRWSPDDRRWLRSRGRDRSARLGKFNPGQKLNAAFTFGAIFVMLGTGSIMRWPDWWAVSWRTGATFVHDWVFLALAVAITGHVVLATSDRDSLSSMVRGSIPAAWARRHAPRWYEEETGERLDRPAPRRARPVRRG